MFNIYRSNSFDKDIKIIKKRWKDFDKLKNVITILSSGLKLETRFRDHELSGNWNKFREYHIEPDWLLIYRIEDNTLELIRTGSHSDLF